MFDWRSFCDRHRIPYSERGAHVAKNNIYVWCPFCAEPDLDKHRMGLSLTSSTWGCWHSRSHAGRNPVRLIVALLRCSREVAEQEAKVGVVPGSWDSLRAKLNPTLEKPVPVILDMPAEYQPIRSSRHPPMRWYLDYIEGRGFTSPHKVARYYDLRAGLSGRQQGRVVMPVRMGGHLRGWTGRAISKRQRLRYLTEPEGPEGRTLLYNYDHAAEGGRVLAVVEGPWDAVKVDWYGREEGVRAVAIMGLDVTAPKVAALARLRDEYDDLAVCLDAGAAGRTMELRARLAALDPRTVRLPAGVKDPGDLRRDQVLPCLGRP